MGRKRNLVKFASQEPGSSSCSQVKRDRNETKLKPGSSSLGSKLGLKNTVPVSTIKPKRKKMGDELEKSTRQKIGASNIKEGRRSRSVGARVQNVTTEKVNRNRTRKKKVAGNKCLSGKREVAGSSTGSLQVDKKKGKNENHKEKERKKIICNNHKETGKEKRICDSLSVNRDVNQQNNTKPGQKRKRGGNSDTEKSCKKSRSQTPTSGSVTTRSMRAKKVGVTRFIFDKVCNCSERVYYTIFTDGGLVKGCPCGKRFEQFMKLTGGFDSILDRNTSKKPKIVVERRDYFNLLSIEIICYIFQFLTLREILRFESLSRKLQRAVHASLSVREEIDFNEETNNRKLFENNLRKLTDTMFEKLLSKLPRVKNIYNFHPAKLLWSPAVDGLCINGVYNAIMACKSLEGIEISNLNLLNYLMRTPSHPKIIGKFQNWNRQFPVNRYSDGLALRENTRITNLHLVGCSVYQMPQMDDHLEHLYLRMVKFTHHHPFKDFSACKLKTFVMAHCVGPLSALKYIPLLTALADARGLKRLELQRVPFLGGVIQHICEDNWQEGGFRRLNSITMGQCKNALDADLGYLVIAAAAHLESLKIQPSLTRDAVFAALAISDVTINPGFEELSLGWQEAAPFNETWTHEELIAEGLADLPECQSRLTDSGMRLVGQCFPPLKKLELRSCPHFINPLLWFTPGQHYLRQIRELTLEDCHSMRIEKFCAFLTFLPELRYLTLRAIFKEPPLGCSRVGLSAGTGLGISSALINPQHVGNNQAAGNNNDMDNNRNQPAHEGQGNNRAENDGIENEAANQNEVGDNVANRNAGAEIDNRNGRYSLRHSARRASGQSVQNQGSSEQDGLENKGGRKTRKSARLSDREVRTRGFRSNSNHEACDGNQSVRPGSSSGSCSSRSDHLDSTKGTVSRRGKALVTKKGLVHKVKSSKGKGKGDENASSENIKEEAGKYQKTCTCVKEKTEAACQVSADELRKASSRKNVKRQRSARRSRGQENVITAGKYRPSSECDGLEPSPSCPRHPRKQLTRPEMVDKCDSTNDPVWEEDHPMVLTILHRRLEYLKLDAIGITELSIVCYNLQTLSISRCRVLKDIKLKEAPFLENVHVSQCRKVNESLLLDEIYRLPPNRSKFVSLRPMHYVDHSLYHDVMFFGDFQQYNFGTLMVFDYSDQPSKTNYNKLRMKSWMGMLERMTTMTMMDHGWQRFHEMEEPNKGLIDQEGESCDGSKWKMFSDIPWIAVLDQCPDMEEKNMRNPEWKKAGVYCMEAKGHFSFWDAYADVQEYIATMGHNHCGLYECNVLTYINMCDINGVPSKDALNIL